MKHNCYAISLFISPSVVVIMLINMYIHMMFSHVFRTSVGSYLDNVGMVAFVPDIQSNVCLY